MAKLVLRLPLRKLPGVATAWLPYGELHVSSVLCRPEGRTAVVLSAVL